MSKKRVCVHTLGCRLNQAESGLLSEQFIQAGYELVPFGEPADVGVINTCTVTREADAKCRQAIRGFIRRNPRAFTIVTGCYSQLGHEALAKIEGVDLILGNARKMDVLNYVSPDKNPSPVVVRERISRDDFIVDCAGDGPVTQRTNLKIQDGCDFMCSFCTIPFARGRERSRKLDDLLAEAGRLVERGAKELVLTGVNVGRYSHNGHGITEVVDRLNELDALARIRISSIEATTVPEGLFERMNDPVHRLVPYLHIPAQSGSNDVLSLMKRKHKREDFLDFIGEAARAVRDLCIGTDLLVGHPGESDRDFAETASLLRDSPIAYAHVFKYSERPNTLASRNADKVDPRLINERSAELRQISAEKWDGFRRGFLGRAMPVLFEEKPGGTWLGHTENYIRVGAASREHLVNCLREVHLEAVGGDWVKGRLSDDGHRSDHA